MDMITLSAPGEYLIAFDTRFIITCSILFLSAVMMDAGVAFNYQPVRGLNYFVVPRRIH